MMNVATDGENENGVVSGDPIIGKKMMRMPTAAQQKLIPICQRGVEIGTDSRPR